MAIKPISSEEIVARMRHLFERAYEAQSSSVVSGRNPIREISQGVLPSLGSTSIGQSEQLDFQAVLKDAVKGVSDAQNVAQSKAQSYQLGNDGTTLEEVMISIQKANLAMQGMIQVRNRLVEAYREVMNLQV